MSNQNQQKLVDFYGKINNARPKIDEPESFAPKKDCSPNAFKMDASSNSEELSLCSCDNFSSKDDSTPSSSSSKTSFHPETSETHIFVATSDLESVNSADESTLLSITSNVETPKPKPLSMTHGEGTPTLLNLNDNVIDDSSSFEFHFDIKPFEDHLNNETNSHGTESSTPSHEGISSLEMNHLKECRIVSPSSSDAYEEITSNVNETVISKFNSILTSPSFEDNETFAAANGFCTYIMKKDKHNSTSSSILSEETSNHGEPTLNSLFRSTLLSGSETKDGPREIAFERENTILSPPPTKHGETTSKPSVENSDTSPSTCGEHLIDFDEEDTPFDEPPSPPSTVESPMVYADVVESHAATAPSSHGQHLSVHSVSPSHSFCTNAEPSSIERQLTLVGKLLDSK